MLSPCVPPDVRFRGNTGKYLLVLSFSQFDSERTSLAVADSRRSVLICTDSADTDLESLWPSHPQGMQKMLLFRPVRELSGECRPIWHDSVEASTTTTSVSAMETRHAHPVRARQFAASGIGRPLRSSASVCNLDHVALRRSGCPTGWT